MDGKRNSLRRIPEGEVGQVEERGRKPGPVRRRIKSDPENMDVFRKRRLEPRGSSQTSGPPGPLNPCPNSEVAPKNRSDICGQNGALSELDCGYRCFVVEATAARTCSAKPCFLETSAGSLGEDGTNVRHRCPQGKGRSCTGPGNRTSTQNDSRTTAVPDEDPGQRPIAIITSAAEAVDP